MRDTVSRLCRERVHVPLKFVSPNHDREEDPIVPDKSEVYEMHLYFPPRINCNEVKIMVKIIIIVLYLTSVKLQRNDETNYKTDSFTAAWYLLGNSKWLSWKRPLDYLSVCQKFLKEHSVQFPNMCQLAEEQLTPGNSNPQGTRENDWT